MDDLFDRFLKTLAFMVGGYLLIYVLIATSSERPAGLSLVYYNFMNQVFYWLFRLFVIGVIGLILYLVSTFFIKVKAKKKRMIEEEKRKLEFELKRKAYEEDAKIKKRIHEEVEALKERNAETERQNRITEKEKYLKNRSAKEANDDALKNFL